MPRSIESRSSWVVAIVALAVLTVSYGAPLVTVVAMKPISEEFGTARSAPALAVSLSYVGSGLGGILMGWIAGRIGIRCVVIGCGIMLAAGLAIASFGGLWSLYVCNLLLIGLLGAAGMFSPIMAYLTRWFDDHRGTAVALVSSGQYMAGALWPLLLQVAIAMVGWRQTMLVFAALVLVTIVPLAGIFFRAPPEAPSPGVLRGGAAAGAPVLGLPANLVLALLSLAIFCCCVTMAMPLSHMVAFCTDIGIGPAQGAAMLSTQLAIGFVAQQMWGWLADRIGGLSTILCASASMAVAMLGFLLTHNEVGLFSVSAMFGLAFGGLIPGYILTVRALYPAEEVSWRIPIVLFPGSLGMALGGWLAGVMYDAFGFYTPAFAAGIGFNLLNVAVIAPLALREKTALGQPVRL
jgi:MFS family permease